jgi:predicted O-linked N-acetylglucosamine transferase (SPINDLY family)
MLTLPETFALAQHHHRAGRLADAEAGYRILAIDPGHAGSLHFLGVIAHQFGRSDIAAHLIGRALAVNPGSAEAHVRDPLTTAAADLCDRSATVFWSAQSLYKYLPQYDCVFPRIARELGDVQFAFIRYPYGEDVTELSRKRLDRAFAELDLDSADFCVLLPFLDQQQFVAAAGLCDIVLDSIGWSGGVSTLESLEHDLPIVTLPSSLMRGRHILAVLELMGVTNTVAGTVDDYVSLAVRLARDRRWRMQVKERIAAAKHLLYRDDTCIAALEEFLLSVTRSETRTPSRLRPFPARERKGGAIGHA